MTETYCKTLATELEFAQIFKVKEDCGRKKIHCYGFFVDQGNGTFAIYRPEKRVISISHWPNELDAFGTIEIVPAAMIYDFINEIAEDAIEVSWRDINKNTPNGWYYDKLV